jgi:predicted ABC-type transport system involved in lysophospholipase L1 biosynthesis ATPase subunit
MAFPLERPGDLSDAKRKKRVRELLSTVGMEKDLDKLPSQMSIERSPTSGSVQARCIASLINMPFFVASHFAFFCFTLCPERA